MPLVEALPPCLSADAVRDALQSDTVACAILGKNAMPSPGDRVGIRLNLNVLARTGVAVQTIHAATNRTGYRRNKGFYRGEAIGYAEAVVLKDAFFNVSQEGREAIASGQQSKFPMASVDGTFVGLVPDHGFEGVPLRFNPKKGHLFVDPDGYAIQGADEVVVLGHRAYARGTLRYHTDVTAPKRAGSAPSDVRFRPEPVWNPSEETPIRPRRSCRA